MKTKILLLLFAVIGLQGFAAEIFDTQVLFSLKDGMWDGVLVSTDNYTDSVTWTHTLNNLDSLSSIESASLTLQGIDIIDTAELDVYLDNTQIGTISFGSNFEETIDIDPTLIEGNGPDFETTAELKFVYSGSTNFLWFTIEDMIDSAILVTSTLSVTGTCANPTPAPVPAPGAIILAGLGTATIGMLRRRFN